MAAPVSPTAGQIPDDAFWTAEVYDRWVDLYGAWTPYTPVWSTASASPVVSLGNGTLTGAYKALGKTVCFRLRWVAGTTTTYGDGLWSFTLPTGYGPASSQAAAGLAVSATSARYPLGAYLTAAAGVFRMAANGTSGVRSNNATPANAQPFAWSANATVLLGGIYEAS